MATLLTLCFSSAVALLSAQFLKDILILQCSDPQQSSNSFTFTKMLADQESTRNRYVAYDTRYVLCKHLILSISSFMDDGIMSPRGAQLQENYYSLGNHHAHLPQLTLTAIQLSRSCSLLCRLYSSGSLQRSLGA